MANFAQKRSMYTAADTIDRARPLAAALVEREERATRSRMTAYERVASRIGVSASWLRRLIGRGSVAVAHHEFMNLFMAYERLCDRLEAEAEQEKKILLALKEHQHAALEMALSPLVLPQADQGTDKTDILPPLA